MSFPWSGKIFNEMEETAARHHQHIHALETSARQPLTEDQENLLSELLEIANGMDVSQNPNDLEAVLSSEPYLAYLKAQDGVDYEDFAAYIAAMPTAHMTTVARARIKAVLGTDKSDKELEVWTNYYFLVREWGTTVEDPHDIVSKYKEINALHQQYLIEPLMESGVEVSGLHSHIVQIGMSSMFMTEHNQVFKEVWYEHLKVHGEQEGLLRCAIAAPGEFALMRSFFTDITAFQALFFHRPEPEEQASEQSN